MEHILLVEDNAGLREALTETLTHIGFTVHPAESGADALRLAEQMEDPIDLVISDLVMPGMNAMELYDALQTRQYTGKMLIITGYPMPHTATSLVSRPNVAWAHKPIGIPELQLILAQLMTTRPTHTV